MENPTSALEDLFLRQKPARLLLSIKKQKEPYASLLAKKIDCTYAHTTKLLNQMNELGLVDFKKDGRNKFVTLTNQGQDLADEFEILIFRRMAGKQE